MTACTIIYVFFFFCQITLSIGSTSKTSSSPSSPVHLFLSFRGADVRDNKSSLLYEAFNRRGFSVFKDDESIRIGHNFSLEIQVAINMSMGAAIIFSPNFATSEWCLDELVLILKRKQLLGDDYVLHPIYVDDVVPGDLRYQRKGYAEALDMHRKKNVSIEDLKIWIVALTEVADYKGRTWVGNWVKIIDQIVEDTSEEFLNQLGIKVKSRHEQIMDSMFEDVEPFTITWDFLYRCWLRVYGWLKKIYVEMIVMAVIYFILEKMGLHIDFKMTIIIGCVYGLLANTYWSSVKPK